MSMAGVGGKLNFSGLGVRVPGHVCLGGSLGSPVDAWMSRWVMNV